MVKRWVLIPFTINKLSSRTDLLSLCPSFLSRQWVCAEIESNINPNQRYLFWKIWRIGSGELLVSRREHKQSNLCKRVMISITHRMVRLWFGASACSWWLFCLCVVLSGCCVEVLTCVKNMSTHHCLVSFGEACTVSPWRYYSCSAPVFYVLN